MRALLASGLLCASASMALGQDRVIACPITERCPSPGICLPASDEMTLRLRPLQGGGNNIYFQLEPDGLWLMADWNTAPELRVRSKERDMTFTELQGRLPGYIVFRMDGKTPDGPMPTFFAECPFE